MIEITHLTKKYGDHLAVNDLTFTAEKGKIYGFLGPNGAGKTTTMNIMTGYLAATSGTVSIDGSDIIRDAEQAKAKIGYLPEIPPVYTDMTVKEYLQFAAELKKVPGKERAAAVEKAMLSSGTKEMENRLIRNLSKGYKQRVGLAQAIINDPEIIILDEPTVGLDPEQQKEMFDYVRTLRDDHIVILSSHILSDVSDLCDYVWIINKGKMIASDTPQGLQTQMKNKQEVRICVLGNDPDILRNELIKLPSVSDVQLDYTKTVPETSLSEISLAILSEGTEDLRPAISDAVFACGMKFLSMNRTQQSLEDIFLTLTHEDDVELDKLAAASRFLKKKKKKDAEVPEADQEVKS